MNNGNLLPKDVALRIGTYVNGKADDGKKKGDAKDRTIFVAIASYRDFQCRYVCYSLFLNADFVIVLRWRVYLTVRSTPIVFV